MVQGAAGHNRWGAAERQPLAKTQGRNMDLFDVRVWWCLLTPSGLFSPKGHSNGRPTQRLAAGHPKNWRAPSLKLVGTSTVTCPRSVHKGGLQRVRGRLYAGGMPLVRLFFVPAVVFSLSGRSFLLLRSLVRYFRCPCCIPCKSLTTRSGMGDRPWSGWPMTTRE